AGRGRSCPARATRCLERARAARRRAGRRRDRVRRRRRPPVPADRRRDPIAARAADASCDRPAARAGDAAHQPPPRADGGLLGDDREADEARRRRRRRPDDAPDAARDGRARRGDDQRRARLVRKPRSRGCGDDKTAVGAGSTLVAPLVAKWSSDYEQRAGVTITYGAIGSGGGIAQITARSIDFGASDAPLTPNEASARKNCVQVPWALGA